MIFAAQNLENSGICCIFAPENLLVRSNMEAITFSPAQVHVFNLVSHIKSAIGLERLREQLAAFYAKQVDDEMDALWESGQFDEKRLQELRGSHFRTPYNK
jgi:hypothetical protein